MIWLIIAVLYIVSYILTYFIIKGLFIYSMNRRMKSGGYGREYVWNEYGNDTGRCAFLSLFSILAIFAMLFVAFLDICWVLC